MIARPFTPEQANAEDADEWREPSGLILVRQH